jgi:hypothetical protein
METFVGLDVSLKDTSVCILNQTGTLVFEGKVASEPTAIARLISQARHRRRPSWPRERADIGVAHPYVVGRGPPAHLSRCAACQGRPVGTT